MVETNERRDASLLRCVWSPLTRPTRSENSQLGTILQAAFVLGGFDEYLPQR
jgi:hypothetical protein